MRHQCASPRSEPPERRREGSGEPNETLRLTRRRSSCAMGQRFWLQRAPHSIHHGTQRRNCLIRCLDTEVEISDTENSKLYPNERKHQRNKHFWAKTAIWGIRERAPREPLGCSEVAAGRPRTGRPEEGSDPDPERTRWSCHPCKGAVGKAALAKQEVPRQSCVPAALHLPGPKPTQVR